jgi:Flp pilus assembly protein TadD
MEPERGGFVTRAPCRRRAGRRESPLVRVPLAIALLAAGLAGCAQVEASRLLRSGSAALDRGEPARAVAELERAAALAPQASAVQNHLGIAYERSGRPSDARRAYERAVELDCENEAARANLQALGPAGTAEARP